MVVAGLARSTLAAAALLRPPHAPALLLRSRVALLSADAADGDGPHALHRRLTKLAEDARTLPPAELHSRLTELTASAAALRWTALDASSIEALRVDELREALAARGLPNKGLKAELRERLVSSVAVPPQAPPSAPRPAEAARPPAPGAAPYVMRSEAAPDSKLSARLAKLTRRHAGIGPQSGIFCDGGCSPNPGPGGWGVVSVRDAQVEWLAYGHESSRTTNNRMELCALIAALERLPPDSAATLYSDSNLCVRSLNEWAAGWERRGWRRSGGQPVENVDLVRCAYQLARSRPKVSIQWLRGHSGATWNEYADALASWRLRER